ncbi:MAG: hypothetical protein WCP59_08035 [Actinomycetota bacterium]|jgi:hypothetical protein
MTAVCVFLFVHLGPRLIFTDTRPVAGDLIVHNGLVGFVTKHFWDHGLMSGWSMQWSAGFPAYRFYISLPALFVAMLDVLFPAAIALKLAAVIPLMLVPVAVYVMCARFGLDHIQRVLAAAASLLFLFDSSQTSFGGNIGSTVTGEFPFAWGLVMVVFGLGVVAADLRRHRLLPGAVVLVAAALLCHPIAGIVMLIGVLAMACVQPPAQWRSTLRTSAVTVAVAGLIAAYWYVPFLWYGEAAIDGNFTRRTDFAHMLFPFSTGWELLFGVLAIAGVVDVIRKRQRPLIALLVVTGVCLVIVPFLRVDALGNVRFLPYWNLFRMVFVGLGAAAVVQLLARGQTADRVRAVGASVLTLCVLFAISWNMGTLPFDSRTTTTLGGWKLTLDATWLVGPTRELTSLQQVQLLSFGGLERGPYYDEFQQLVRTLDEATADNGCGRLGYEFDPTSRYGSVYALQLLPAETDGCVSVVNGLVTGAPVSNLQFVAETSWSLRGERYFGDLPYEQQPDLDVAVRYLRELGATYYLALSPEIIEVARSTDGLTELAAVGPWVLFHVEGTRLVEPLAAQPLVDPSIDSKVSWADASMQWFIATDPSLRRFSPDGPATWQRASWEDADAPLPEGAAGDESVQVTDVLLGDDSIRFRVDTVGVPVLVRVSWYPTWVADGAAGPWRAAPNWMVVVPTENEVVLRVEAGQMETVSSLTTLFGVVVAAALATVALVRRRRMRNPGPPIDE